MKFRHGDRIVNAVIVGSPNVNSGYYLVNNKDYPSIAEDYVMTFQVLHGLPCDIFLGAHGLYFDMLGKLAHRNPADPETIWDDPASYRTTIAAREQDFLTTLHNQQQSR